MRSAGSSAFKPAFAAPDCVTQSVCPLTPCAGFAITQHMDIYKILRGQEWADLRAKGQTPGAPVDIADGFIHFSTAEQARETAAKHFAAEDGLMLAAFDPDRMGAALKWEPSRGGALFPHLYGPMRLADVTWAQPLPLGPDGHRFPDGFA